MHYSPLTMRLLLLLALTTFASCGCEGKPVPPPPECVDQDQDGVDSCSDCDDADPLRAPGRAELCDGKDNDCNAVVDDGAACACSPGTAPVPCGFGGACQQQCLPTGQLAECLPPGASAFDAGTDPLNCGQCGRSCAAPANAATRCAQGECGRGPCQAGFFDLDGPVVFGCESTCVGRQCTFPDGGTITVHNDPLPESNSSFHAFAAGSSLADKVQTNSQFTNQGVLGQGVPQGEEAVGGAYRHVGGFTSAVK